MGGTRFGAAAVMAAGLALVACRSNPGADGTGGAAAGTGGSGTGGLASGSGGSGTSGTGGTSATGSGGNSTSVVDAGGGDSAGTDAGLPASAACTPGVGTGPLADTEVSCNDSATAFGVPNGVACYGKTYVLPKPLVVGADNALSFVLTGWGPYNFELWGSTSTLCKAEELLWWGPFGAGTQCAQFRPSKAYTHILFVYRQMYSANYSFGTPSTMMCPGGTCPMGTTGTGKLSATPLTAPVGNYELGRTDRLIYGLDMDLGRSGRATVSWTGAIPPKKVNEAQPLSAGVFRMPATDPFGDAWYCAGDGSTLTEVRKDNFSTSSFQFSMRGVTRLGECGETAGTASISASIYLSSTTGTYFAADIAGTISAWNGTNMVASPNCYGSACNIRFRNAGQEHFVHVQTTLTDISLDTMGPTAVTSAVWLVQPTTTQPFAMACSSEGTLNYRANEPSTLQLAKVTSPRSCPGTPIANDRIDFTVER